VLKKSRIIFPSFRLLIFTSFYFSPSLCSCEVRLCCCHWLLLFVWFSRFLVNLFFLYVVFVWANQIQLTCRQKWRISMSVSCTYAVITNCLIISWIQIIGHLIETWKRRCQPKNCKYMRMASCVLKK
jgi:hypothetical protein